MTSALVVAELFAGVRHARERDALDALVRARDVLPVDADAADRKSLARHFLSARLF